MRTLPPYEISLIGLNYQFHQNVINDDVDSMEISISRGADVNSLNYEKKSALYVAISNNYSNIYTNLMALHKVDVTHNGQDKILLDWVCAVDNLNAFSLLHTYKANIGYIDNSGRTLLHNCIKYDSQSICKYLLNEEYSIDINGKDMMGQTALHHACLNSNLKITQLLCERNDIDINAIDRYGRTPFFFACNSNKNIEIVQYLINKDNIKLNLRDNNNKLPLDLACASKADIIVKELWANKRIYRDYGSRHILKCLNEKPHLFV